MFVELEEGVDGLIHISDLSWTKKVKHPSEFTQVGAPIEVKVLEIDKDNRRLSLRTQARSKRILGMYSKRCSLKVVYTKARSPKFTTKGAVVQAPIMAWKVS